MSALLCSSTSMLLSDPLDRVLRRSRRRRQRRPWSWPRIGTRSSGRGTGLPDRHETRPVMAVLALGRPPERVVVEAAALAAQEASPLRVLVLRGALGYSSDAALVAAAERCADAVQRELLSRAADALSRSALDGIDVDVVRIAGTDFDAPSAWVTRRVLATARRRGVGVVVMPAVLLGAAAAPPSITVVPVEDDGGRMVSGTSADPERGTRSRPHPSSSREGDPAGTEPLPQRRPG